MTMRDGEEEARRKSGTSVSRNTISSLERGVHKPRSATLEALAWAYGGETEHSPKTIMNLWRLELAQRGVIPDKEGGDRAMFLAWAVGRDGVIHNAPESERLEVIDLYLDKEESEAKRRHLENWRGEVERGKYEPINFGGRVEAESTSRLMKEYA
jgi:transcriptional regulator with XRE-family HTH domain